MVNNPQWPPTNLLCNNGHICIKHFSRWIMFDNQVVPSRTPQTHPLSQIPFTGAWSKIGKEGMEHSLLETTDQISELFHLPLPPPKKKNQTGYWMFGFQFGKCGADVTVVIYSCSLMFFCCAAGEWNSFLFWWSAWVSQPDELCFSAICHFLSDWQHGTIWLCENKLSPGCCSGRIKTAPNNDALLHKKKSNLRRIMT